MFCDIAPGLGGTQDTPQEAVLGERREGLASHQEQPMSPGDRHSQPQGEEGGSSFVLWAPILGA